MKYLSVFLLSLLSLSAHARSGSVSGTIYDANSRPLPMVNLLLLRAADSSLAKTGISDDQGRYTIDPVADGSYLVKASRLGYEPAFSAPVTVDGGMAAVPDIRLQEQRKDMKEVTVRAQKPLIEVHADKIVMNVENSIVSTGSTALEVLQRAPGVNVDQNDNISLKGRQGVNIMIDGKLIPIQGADLANLLKGMPSGSIEKIEIISNPGARYDAAGTAGIINIRTKRDKRMGTNGSVTAGYTQGIYPKYNGGFNLNYRGKKVTVYANYNYGRRIGINELFLYRRFLENDAITGIYDQHNFAKIRFENHTASAGMDYVLSSRTTVGAIFTGGGFSTRLHGDNQSRVLDAAGEPTYLFNTQTDNHNNWRNYGLNLNLRHQLDTAGRELSVDADYARYTGNNYQDIYTTYFHTDGSFMKPDYHLYGELNGHTDIRSLKADYTHPLKSGTRLEAGFKTSFVTADNDPAFYDRSGGGNRYDSSRSNHFIYHENINAVYVNANKDWKQWSVQLGLRGEQTIANGHQLVDDTRFDRNYFQLFPSLALTRHLNAAHDLGVTLSRRIDRPNYRQLNPFKDYLDVSSIHQGNPYLNPALTYAVELSHTFKNRFITQVSWSRTTDVITQVIQPEANQITIVTDKNLATNSVYSLSGTYPFQPFKWWSSTNSINAFYSHFEGDLANTPLSDGTPAFSVSTQNTLTLPRNWTAEASGWYQSEQRYGYMFLHDMWALNFGFQKAFLDKKATLRLNVTDIFWRQNPEGESNFRDYREDFIVRRDSRTAGVSFAYRFGNRSVAPVRRRMRGAEDELRRAGGGNGGA